MMMQMGIPVGSFWKLNSKLIAASEHDYILRFPRSERQQGMAANGEMTHDDANGYPGRQFL